MQIIYVVEWVKPDMKYWVFYKAFFDKDVADAYCKYLQYNASGCKYRVMQEVVE